MNLTLSARRPAPQAARGFTLIELLAVVAIIAIISAILIPAIASNRDNALLTKCRSNEKQVFTGVLHYANDNRDRLPGPCDPDVYAYAKSNQLGTFVATYLGQDTTAAAAATNTNPLLICPAWQKGWREGTPVGRFTWYRCAADGTGARGGPLGLPPSVKPWLITMVRKPSETFLLCDNDALVWDTVAARSDLANYPVHGVRSQTSKRNLAFFDGHIDTSTNSVSKVHFDLNQ